MIFMYSLPTKKCIKHLKNSISIYEKETTYYRCFGNNMVNSQLDNFTDAVMLLTSTYTAPKDEIIKTAMMNPHLRVDKLNPTDSLVKFYKNDNSYSKIDYSRYWHGYCIILKPLLMLIDVGIIRSFNYCCVVILFCLSILLFYKKLGIFYTIAYFLSIMTLNLVSISMCFQFSTIYYISILFSIFILIKNDFLIKNNLFPYFFTLIGILVAFFDLLSYPIVAFGIPFITLYLLNHDYLLNIKNSFFFIVSFVLGYLGMWFGKWFVCWFLTGYNCFLDAFNQIKVRISIDSNFNEQYHITPLHALFKNIVAMSKNPIFIFIIFFILCIIVYALIKNKKISINSPLKTLFFYIALILCPIFWLLITSGHSQIHFWFTYRTLSISLFAFLCFIIECFKFEEKIGKI